DSQVKCWSGHRRFACSLALAPITSCDSQPDPLWLGSKTDTFGSGIDPENTSARSTSSCGRKTERNQETRVTRNNWSDPGCLPRRGGNCLRNLKSKIAQKWLAPPPPPPP